MSEQKRFLKDVTDNTVQSILHPKKYIREKKELRGKFPTKPIPTSGPDKWIQDLLKKSSNYNAKQSGVKSKDVADPSYFEKVAKDWEFSFPNPIRMVEDLFMPPNKITQEYFDSKKNSNVTPKQIYLKPEKPKNKLPLPVIKKGNLTSEQFFESLPINTNTYGPKNQQTADKNPQGSSKLQPKNTTKSGGAVNQKVIEWQKKLKAEGFDPGAIDGKWGKKTEAAYQAYLKNKKALERVGLPEDNAPFIEARQGFPTPESAYYKQGGKMEFKYLKKGGKMGKKCSCGCAMKISKNAKGGLIESCACGCKTKK